MLKLMLEPSLGSELPKRAKMSPRGPSLALKRQTPAFKKPEKTRWFLMFSGPETSQETLKKPKSRPRSTQRPPKNEKNPPKKIKISASVVKNALSWRSHFRRFLNTIFEPKIALFLTCFIKFVFTTFSKNVETHFGTHFGIRVGQEGQDEPRRAIRSFKEPKTFIFKNLKKPMCFLKVFGYRGLSRKPQEAEEGSQKSPKKSKIPKIGIQN